MEKKTVFKVAFLSLTKAKIFLPNGEKNYYSLYAYFKNIEQDKNNPVIGYNEIKVSGVDTIKAIDNFCLIKSNSPHVSEKFINVTVSIRNESIDDDKLKLQFDDLKKMQDFYHGWYITTHFNKK